MWRFGCKNRLNHALQGKQAGFQNEKNLTTLLEQMKDGNCSQLAHNILNKRYVQHTDFQSSTASSKVVPQNVGMK